METAEACTQRSAQELLAEFRANGRGEPFEEIVRRYAGMVFHVCLQVTKNTHDAEDATQAVFLTLAVQAKTAREIRCLGPWLQQVARRLSLDMRKSRKRREKREETHGRMSPLNHATMDCSAPLHAEELKALLHEEMHGLPAKYRLPLVLHYFGGLSREAMAAELQCKTGTLGARLYRARAMLSARLAQRGIVLANGSLDIALACSIQAAITDSLVASTCQAATQLAAGREIGVGLISVKVISMVGRAVQAALYAKLKGIAILLLVGATAIGAGAEVVARTCNLDLRLRLPWDVIGWLRALLAPVLRPQLTEASGDLTQRTVATAAPASAQSLLSIPRQGGPLTAVADDEYSRWRSNLGAQWSEPLLSGLSKRTAPNVFSRPPLPRSQFVTGPVVSGLSERQVAAASPAVHAASLAAYHESPAAPFRGAVAPALPQPPPSAEPLPQPVGPLAPAVLPMLPGQVTPLAPRFGGDAYADSRMMPPGPELSSPPPPRLHPTSQPPTPPPPPIMVTQVTRKAVVPPVVGTSPVSPVLAGAAPPPAPPPPPMSLVYGGSVTGQESAGVVRFPELPKTTAWLSASTILTSSVDAPKTEAFSLAGGHTASLYNYAQTCTLSDSITYGRGTACFDASTLGQVTVLPDAIRLDGVRVDASANTLRGWGKVLGIDFLDQNGQVVADGLGKPRTLDLTQVETIANTTQNPAPAGANGWFARDRGKLSLRPLAVVPGTHTYTWGESDDDPNLDLINSVRATLRNVAAPGQLDIALLSLDRADVPALPEGHHFIGLWQFKADDLQFDSVGLTIRYDYVTASQLSLDEPHLKLWGYHDGQWQVLQDAFRLDMDLKLISAGTDDLSYFAVSTPEPGGMLLLGLGTLLLSRRRRRVRDAGTSDGLRR